MIAGLVGGRTRRDGRVNNPTRTNEARGKQIGESLTIVFIGR